MSLLNQNPNDHELLLLSALESMGNATMTVVQESESTVVVIVVVVVNICVFCCCVILIRCVSKLNIYIFFFEQKVFF